MRRRHLAIVVVLVAVALLTWLRVVLVDRLPDQGYFAKYLTFADAIAAGRMPTARLGDFSPAYLWLVVLLRRLGAGVQAIRTLQIVAVSFAALACGAAAQRFGGWMAAVAAMAIVLANRAALVCATDLEPETLILLLNAIAVMAAVRLAADGAPERESGATTSSAASRTPRVAALLGLALGLSAIARPVAVGSIVLAGIWLALRHRRAILPFAIAALAPIAIVVGVNHHLTGAATIMDPGTVFYEGNNALASGAAGVLPRIVADLEQQAHEPDYLHVAYRIVASRAAGRTLTRDEVNRYWTSKALAFMRAFPAAEGRLLARKALLAIHDYDVFDLATLVAKSKALDGLPWLPFGLLVALALAAAFLGDRRQLLPVALLAAAPFAVLIVFYVSARQRNALLPMMAVLAAAGVSSLAQALRARDRRGALVLALTIVVAVALALDTRVTTEDQYAWYGSFAAQQYDGLHTAEAAAMASTWRTAAPPTAPPNVLRAVTIAAAQQTAAPERQFDFAIALQKCGAWRESDAILAQLDDYRPVRENRAVSSVAYYRARAAIHLGAPAAVLRALADIASDEAPGDPQLLALRARLGDANAAALLARLYDPFTARGALVAPF